MSTSFKKLVFIFLSFLTGIFHFSHLQAKSSSLLHKTDSNFAATQTESVSNLTGFYRHGQVFLTWQNTADPATFYKVYRSTQPIISTSQLSQIEYLGLTNSESAKDHNLSKHDGFSENLVIDSGAAPLPAGTGLFVATTLANGNYYYAVTTFSGSDSDNSILAGKNSLQESITEVVEEPRPVHQQTRVISNQKVEIYTFFNSMKYAPDQPSMIDAGFVANDFALYLNHITGAAPMQVHFHGGGSDFLTSITQVPGGVINLCPEDYFPSGDNSGWWGTNENFDIYDTTQNSVPPTSGINYNFSQIRMSRILDWAIKNLPVDSNRIYFDGTSFGSIGAYFYAMTFPERIAAVKLSVGVFNLAFQSDYDPICTLNAGGGNRKSGNERFGTVSSNLMTNLGYPIYNMLNGGWLAHTFNEKNYPVIYSVNGKYDTLVGWTEKTLYYDSVNTYHMGGYYFWDSRTHGGIGATWGEDNFDLFRYLKNRSYPAFANCSVNENFGDGHATSGAKFGTVNGFLDWNDNVIDETSQWKATVFLRDLKEVSGATYAAPASCTVDITPRRLQNFTVTEGDALAWTVTYKNQVTQSGSLFYAGGVITIPGITVYKDSVQIELVNQTLQDSIGFTTTSLIIYPNPFSQSTSIRWELPQPARCSVKIYDAVGRLTRTLVDEDESEGIHQVNWPGDLPNGAPVSNGVYFVRLDFGTGSETKQLVVVK